MRFDSLSEEEVIAAQLVYYRNGDDKRMLAAFHGASSLPIHLSVYPLDDSLCNEMTFLLAQQIAVAESNNVSILANMQSHLYFALFSPPTGEMIGAVRWTPKPQLNEETGELVFAHRESPFVYLLPGTSLFPDADELGSLIVDARLSVKIIN